MRRPGASGTSGPLRRARPLRAASEWSARLPAAIPAQSMTPAYRSTTWSSVSGCCALGEASDTGAEDHASHAAFAGGIS